MVRKWVKKGTATRPSGRTRRVRRNQIVKTIPNPKRTFTLEIDATINVSNGGGGVAAWATSVAYNFPTYGTNPGNTYAQYTSISTLYARVLAAFDEYRVKQLRIDYVPYSVDTDVPNYATPSSNQFYATIDYDDVTLMPSEVVALNAGCKLRNASDGRNLSVVMRQTKSLRSQYFNTGTIALAPGTAPPANNSILPPQAYSSVKILFPGVTPSAALGKFVLRWTVQFRGVKFN